MTSQNTNYEFMRRNKNVNKRRIFKNVKKILRNIWSKHYEWGYVI